MNDVDIKIIELEKKPFKDLQSSSLVLELSGKLATTTLANTLRRLVIDYVPTYAFTKETINIEENSSIFFNDKMKLRFSQITIPNINIPIAHLSDKYWKNIKYNDENRQKHPDDNENIEMYINIRNDEIDNINVTTNHAKFYFNGDEKKEVFNKKFPHLLVQLRPKEVFKCRAYCVLGVGLNDNIFSAASRAYFDEISKHKINLSIHSQGQIDEYDALYRGCICMINELKDIKNKIQDRYKNTAIEGSLEINLDDKDYTIGYILNQFLQDNPNIEFSGMSKPDHLRNRVRIKMVSSKPNPLKFFFDTIDYLVTVFEKIKKELKKIGGKYILYKE